MTSAIPLAHRRDVADLTRAIDRLVEADTQRRRARELARLEARLANALRAIFRKQERAVVRALRGLPVAEASVYREMLHGPRSGIVVPPAMYRTMQEAAEPDWEALYDAAVAEDEDAFAEALETFLALAIAAGAIGMLLSLGLPAPADLPTRASTGYARTYAADLVGGINAITKGEIRALVTSAIEQGRTSKQLADDLRQQYRQYHGATPGKRDRAALIAMTELGNAWEAGAEAQAVVLARDGGGIEKAWVTRGDDRVSRECRSNEAAGWIAFRQAFPSGHTRPLAHPGCRCRCAYRRVEANARES